MALTLELKKKKQLWETTIMRGPAASPLLDYPLHRFWASVHPRTTLGFPAPPPRSAAPAVATTPPTGTGAEHLEGRAMRHPKCTLLRKPPHPGLVCLEAENSCGWQLETEGVTPTGFRGSPKDTPTYRG